MVEWQYPSEVDLDGLEFRAIASGFHKVDSDFMWENKLQVCIYYCLWLWFWLREGIVRCNIRPRMLFVYFYSRGTLEELVLLRCCFALLSFGLVIVWTRCCAQGIWRMLTIKFLPNILITDWKQLFFFPPWIFLPTNLGCLHMPAFLVLTNNCFDTIYS